MNAEVKEVGTALTVVERAVLALGKQDYAPKLIELAAASKSITVITNTDGYQQCHSARMVLKNERVQIANDGKKARDDANAFSKAVIAEEKRLIDIIKPEEDRLDKLQKEWDEARAAEKEAAIQAELRRVADLQERVAELRGNRTLSAMSGAALIAGHIADLEGIAVDSSFQEFEQAATDAKAAGLSWLRQVHSAAVAHETEQARIAAEREELARLRAEQVLRDAAERKRREEEEAAARKARQEEERRADEQRARQKAEDDRIAAERRRVLDEQEAAAMVAREAEAGRQRQEREAHEAQLKREREEQEKVAKAERDRIAEENRQAAADRKVEEDRIAAERAKFAQEQEAARKAAEPPPPTRMRPKAADMIAVIAAHYKVAQVVALGWLIAACFKAQDAA